MLWVRHHLDGAIIRGSRPWVRPAPVCDCTSTTGTLQAQPLTQPAVHALPCSIDVAQVRAFVETVASRAPPDEVNYVQPRCETQDVKPAPRCAAGFESHMGRCGS